MDIKVIGGYILHKGTTYKTDDVIKNVDDNEAKRLCEAGVAETISKSGNEDFHVVDGVKLEELTKAELIVFGAERGIELNKQLTNAKMIEIILEKVDKPNTGMQD